MADAALRPVRVALYAESPSQRDGLCRILREQGLAIVTQQAVSAWHSGQVSDDAADVLLVDLEQMTDAAYPALDRLIRQAVLPLVFTEGLVRLGARNWGRQLAVKLSGFLPGGYRSQICREIPDPAPEAAQVWVLGASIGGPEAVRRFLEVLPSDLDVALILVQHIGARFVPWLAEQLDSTTPWQVRVAESGSLLLAGEMVVVPVGQCFLINGQGRIELAPLTKPSLFSPSIDAVMQEVACRYNDKAGAILFSGMGGDGLTGARAIHRAGGAVWVQDASSCVVSAMADAVRAAGLAAQAGSPEDLAVQMVAQASRCESRENPKHG